MSIITQQTPVCDICGRVYPVLTLLNVSEEIMRQRMILAGWIRMGDKDMCFNCYLFSMESMKGEQDG